MNKDKLIREKLNNLYDEQSFDDSFKSELCFNKRVYKYTKYFKLAFTCVLLLVIGFGTALYIGGKSVSELLPTNIKNVGGDTEDNKTAVIINYDSDSYLRLYYVSVYDEASGEYTKEYYYEVYGFSSYDDSFSVYFNQILKKISPINRCGKIGKLEGELTISIDFEGKTSDYILSLN